MRRSITLFSLVTLCSLGLLVGCSGDDTSDEQRSDTSEETTHDDTSSDTTDTTDPKETTQTDTQNDTSDSSDVDDSKSLFPSDFQTVTVKRTPGVSYCVEKGDIKKATIEIGEDGGATITGEIIVRGYDPQTDSDCPDGTESFGDFTSVCYRTFEPIELDSSQVDTLRERVEDVPPKSCNRDENMACDPCVVPTISVGDTSVDPQCCGDELNQDFQSGFDAIFTYVESLVPDLQN